MGLFDFFWRKKNTASISSDWLNLGWGQTVANVPVNQISAIQNSVVLACVSLLASDVAKLPLRLYRKLPNGTKILAKEHVLAKLFASPNDFMTRYEFMEHIMVNLLLSGNAYAPILRDERGKPRALVPINALQVQIYEAPDTTEYFYFITSNGLHETALLKDFPKHSRRGVLGMMAPKDDMLHIRWMSYANSLWGSDRIGLAKEAIGYTMALEENGARLMGNAGRPSGILTTDAKLGKETIERISASWKTNHGGPQRTGGTAVLEQGLKWQPLTFTSVDAQFIEQRRFQVEEIARIFRVPLYKLAISEDQPGSSILELEQDYVNGTLSSYCDRIIARLYKTFDLSEDEFDITFDFESAIKADIKTRIDNLRIGVLASLYTVNEARVALGLPPVPDGDVILQPTNVAPLGFTPNQAGGGQPGSDVTGKPGTGGDGDEAPKANPNDSPDDAAPNS